MTYHELAEKKVKGLQKEFLVKIEQHPVFQQMEPREFNDLRKRVFRGTFEAYRLGVVGIESTTGHGDLYTRLFGWLKGTQTEYMNNQIQHEIAHLVFRTALEAYRIGAMVAFEREIQEVG